MDCGPIQRIWSPDELFVNYITAIINYYLSPVATLSASFRLCKHTASHSPSFSTVRRFPPFVLQDLRQQLDKLLEEKIVRPGVTNWNESEKEGALMRAIAELISTEEAEGGVGGGDAGGRGGGRYSGGGGGGYGGGKYRGSSHQKGDKHHWKRK